MTEQHAEHAVAANVEHVSGHLAPPPDRRSVLTEVARALARHADEVEHECACDRECCARAALDAARDYAKGCLVCGQPHTPRWSGTAATITWESPVDGHAYAERARPAGYWLDRVLEAGEGRD